MYGTEKDCFLEYLNDFQENRIFEKFKITCNANDRIIKDISFKKII